MSNRIKTVLSLAIALSLSVVWLGAQAKTAAPADKKAPTQAKEMTWDGSISDAMCGKDHGKNGGTMAKDHDCANKCAAKGSYVFVSGDKIFKIADQKSKDLETHAGHKVTVAGTMKGDTITISKVTMAK